MPELQPACLSDGKASQRRIREAAFDARVLWRVAVVCAAYYVAVVVALKLQLGFSQIPVLWPSNAILTAALVLSPKRHWWLYLLAVIPVHIAGYAGRLAGPDWSAVQILHNSVLAIVAAAVMRRFAPTASKFVRVREVAVFLATAVFVPGLLAFGFVVTIRGNLPTEALVRHGWTEGVWDIASRIWLANSVGLLVFLPVILIWSKEWRTLLRIVSLQRLRAPVLIMAGLIFLSLILFTRNFTPPYLLPASFLLPMPFFLWITVRFGARGVSTALLAIVCISAWGAYENEGPFIEQSAVDRAVSVQLFWFLLALPGLSLAATIQERKQAEGSLERGQRRYELAAAAGRVVVWSYNCETGEVFTDPALAALLDYRSDHAKTAAEWQQFIHPDDLESVIAHARNVISSNAPRDRYGNTPVPTIQHRLRRADGEYLWVSNSGTLYRQEGDRPSFAVGTITDITEVKETEEVLRRNHQELEQLAGRLITIQEFERKRLAQELHDDVSQRLAVMAMLLDGLLQDPSCRDRDCMVRARQEVVELSFNIRDLSHQLHPSFLQLGLKTALAGLCRSTSQQSGLQITLEAQEIVLPDEVKLNLFRVAQEALNNALKHSAAKKISISLREEGNVVQLKIRDQGKGFVLTAPSEGIGLLSMRERMRIVGGALTITSQSGAGTEITAAIPREPDREIGKAKGKSA
jgi:PAS domain S-box-containing protein